MNAYCVTLAIGRGSRLDTGARLHLDVIAPSRIDAAVAAERLADQALSDIEYSHTRRVRLIPEREPMTMAVAA